MTIACLLANTYTAACRAAGVEPEPLDASGAWRPVILR
jgi:methylenetetrahydrofolate dehydrogenase (NADP+) / methenyltetrahydrofolate cyclohydrolase